MNEEDLANVQVEEFNDNDDQKKGMKTELYRLS